MTILRSDLDAGRVDLDDVTTGETIPPVTPGEVLRHDFMEPCGIGRNDLAKALKVPVTRIDRILAGRSALTADMAMRLGQFFGTPPQYWLALQADHDLQRAEDMIGAFVRSEIRPIDRSAERQPAA